MTVRSHTLGRDWIAVFVGLLWAQAGIATALRVLPDYLIAGERVSQGWWYRLASWTLLAPLALAAGFTGRPISDPTRTTLLLCPLLGVGLCLTAAWLIGTPRWRSIAVWSIVVTGLLGVVCGGVVVSQLRDADLAEKSFFTLLSHVEVPHKDAATVSAAGEFARRHPDSRWVGEALRIVAMAEWDAGRIESASRLWRQFGATFSDRRTPGVAYAEYNLALCEERQGRTVAARKHLCAAIETIRARGDGIQAWIAADAATRLSALERADGRYALADYWKTKSQTFYDVYSVE